MRKNENSVMGQLTAACESAGVPIYGTSFLCKTLAILYCYGGGPGGEYFRAPVGYAVAMKGQKMLEEAILQKNWAIVRLYRNYVRELQSDHADWLQGTLERLNIPVNKIRFSECVQSKSPKGS